MNGYGRCCVKKIEAIIVAIDYEVFEWLKCGALR